MLKGRSQERACPKHVQGPVPRAGYSFYTTIQWASCCVCVCMHTMHYVYSFFSCFLQFDRSPMTVIDHDSAASLASRRLLPQACDAGAKKLVASRLLRTCVRARACVRACVRAWVRARACVCACVPARACVSVCVFDTSDCSASIPMLRHDSCAIPGHEHAKVSCTFRFVSMRCAAQLKTVCFQEGELRQKMCRDLMVSRTLRSFMS